MNSKSTFLLVAAALGLAAYVYFFERHTPSPEQEAARGQKLFPLFDPAKVASIEIVRSNSFIRVERSGEKWRLTEPAAYPAQITAIENWLNAFAALSQRAWISAQDLEAQPGGLAAFGLEEPRVTVAVRHDGQRIQLRLGDKTSVGEKLYLQRVGSDGVFVTESLLLDRLPESVSDWRDRNFLDLAESSFDRVHVRAGSSEFKVQRNPTNRLWSLTWPRTARADNARIGQLLQQLQSARVDQFVTLADMPGVDLESYGLHSPEAVVSFSLGTNPVLLVEFGKGVTNQPALVHARRSTYPGIVAVPKRIADLFRASYTEFLDHRLIEFTPAAVDRLEARGAEPFALQKETNGVWGIVEPAALPADPALVQGLFSRLNSLQIIDFVKEVASDEDLPTYGLAPPARQFILKSAAAPGGTNAMLAQIDFGTNQDKRVFVRRSDENSVYAVSLDDILSLPQAAFELRDRRIWNFTTNDVVGVAITLKGRTYNLLRAGNGKWRIGDDSQGMVNTFALEEAVFRFGRLWARAWVAQGETHLTRYGFPEAAHKLAIELRNGDKTEPLTLEFGATSASGGPYAAVPLEGGLTVFELPFEIFNAYEEVVRSLSMTAGALKR